ncbi:DUF3109 family protein [Dysgonomonas sp. BGC7]|uniref:DUF3109 family protein n=1 Tax=Dysgonomonas sp. BGC7 TaxID=1658008 RepID=UPI00067FB8C5|nr:DUF3109 family protein [Dysgonomonas sp. BGC7]MBD8389677.1 DUF3109 family protein [Dysgonomonas sp. BGC7]
MIQIGDTVVSLEVIEQKFLCNLSACRGECCVEGDSGAPLEREEVKIIEDLLPEVWADLSPKAQEVIEAQGVAYEDEDGDMVTSIVNGKDCVFTYYDDNGICKCSIEKAHREGRVDFYKPVSCHLYPIRLHKYKDFTAVNYHRWQVCDAALVLGKEKGLSIYKFLKEPLIRCFGENWYNELSLVAEEYNNTKQK